MTLIDDIQTTLNKVARNEIPASAMDGYLAQNPGECMLALVYKDYDKTIELAGLLKGKPELRPLVQSILKGGYAYFEQCPKPEANDAFFRDRAIWEAWRPFFKYHSDDNIETYYINDGGYKQFLRGQFAEPDMPASQRAMIDYYSRAGYPEIDRVACIQSHIFYNYSACMDADDLGNCARLVSSVHTNKHPEELLGSIADETYSRGIPLAPIVEAIGAYGAWFGGDLSMDTDPESWLGHEYPYAMTVCDILREEDRDLLADFSSVVLGRFLSRTFWNQEPRYLLSLSRVAVLKPEKEYQEIVIDGFCQSLAFGLYDRGASEFAQKRYDHAQTLYDDFHKTSGDVWPYTKTAEDQSILNSIASIIQKAGLSFEDAVRRGAKCLGKDFLKRMPAEFQEPTLPVKSIDLVQQHSIP